MLLVKGTIVFEEDVTLPAGATAEVRVEEVSRADAAATVIAREVVRDLGAGGERRAVPFSIHGAALDPRRRYTVRAHVDVDGDGEVGVGDFVSTVSYPIAADRLPATVSIVVRPVH